MIRELNTCVIWSQENMSESEIMWQNWSLHVPDAKEKWHHAHIESIRSIGASLTRNRVDLKPQVSSQQCVEQPDSTAQVGDNTSDLADQTSQNETTDPDVLSVKTPCRLKRNVQPPKRLIESCWTLETVNGFKWVEMLKTKKSFVLWVIVSINARMSIRSM